MFTEERVDLLWGLMASFWARGLLPVLLVVGQAHCARKHRARRQPVGVGFSAPASTRTREQLRICACEGCFCGSTW
jgi:putative copper export protein